MSRKSQIFTVVLLALVGVGLATQLYNNPWGLFKSILVFAVIAGVMYFLVNRLLLSRGTGFKGAPTDKGYQKALRQQKRRNKLKQPGQHASVSMPSPLKLRKMSRLKPSLRRDNPFRVIEGKKNKQKTNKKTKTS
ncbi:SA1362 family protein [Aneurinibacillus thermoaerophilus]|uniref:SA1362 family protein n=1 Tax=Aneurinibacillus thermoaerophilus TaxID=143495 RepID=UPI002E20B191|nr:SA1362 family protein [Aneurinibacillus thermoaerophilus]